MLKLRLQGSMRDINWFLKLINRDRRFIKNKPSDPMDIKGSDQYKRVYIEIFRDENDFRKTVALAGPKKQNWYTGSGTVFLTSGTSACKKCTRESDGKEVQEAVLVKEKAAID